MEQVTGAPEEGKDSVDEQNAPDSSSLTGKTAVQDHQILVDTGDTNWYKSTQALKYLQPVFVPIVKDNIKSLQRQTMTDFGRQLCAEATSDDIIRANGNLAKFKHLCPGTVIACQNLINIIKGHTTDSVRFYQMLIGTDPQNWLKSPFEFARLFLKDWMRRDIHDFKECDITALCTIVMRCKPLMQIFQERKIDELRKVRNRTMHPATMSITQQEMEQNINVILEFLEHIKALTASDDATKAIECIKQLKTSDVSLLHTVVDRLIRGWIPGAKIQYELKLDAKNNQLQDINYMENKLTRMSSAQEATAPTKQSEELELEAKEPMGNWSLDDVSSLENGSAQKQDCNQALPERQADGVDEITTLHQQQYRSGNRQMTFKKLIKRTLGLPILGPCTVTEERDSDEHLYLPFVPMTAGENADQDHQILTDESDTNWFKTTQSLKYLLPVLLSFIEDKIIRLHEKTLTDFGRQLCTEATSDDIIRAEGNVAHFKHLCPGTVVTCQNLLKIIKGHTRDSVDFYQMLKGTDPQNWLKSPFEFARLFLKDWMRSDIHDFQDCDILALCTIIKRCKPLMQIFDERKLDELRNVRNRTMHPYTMSICQHEMEDHMNAILDFLEQMKTLTNTGEVIKAMESITQSRTDDVRSRQTIFVRLIQGWLPGAKMEYKHKLDEANNQLKDIHHMENKLVRVSAEQEATARITQRSS